MKLKFVFGLIAALTLSLAVAQPAFANKKRIHSSQENRADGDDVITKYNTHVMKYVPSDLHNAGQGPGTGCDEQGRPTEMTRENLYGNCTTWESTSTHTKWKIRFLGGGTAERVFQVKERFQDNRKVEYLVLHVRFEPKTLAATPISNEAKVQYAKATDAPSVQVAKDGTPVPTSQSQDCSKMSGWKKTLCDAAPAIGAAIKKP